MRKCQGWLGETLTKEELTRCGAHLGFPGGSAGKESSCNVGDLGWIPGLGRNERLPIPVFWPGESHGLYSPWGRKELDRTERLSLRMVPRSESE